MRDFALAFVSIFVAVDAVGTLPLFVGLTEGMDASARRKVVGQSMITATSVAVGFVFLGKGLFGVLQITVFDFMVAGGAMLFILATLDLASGRKFARDVGAVGAVPLGTPLIVGPAVLTTALMSVDLYGLPATLLAIAANVVLAAGVLLGAGALTRLLGLAGARAVSKVASLILAAIAVMMIRKGLTGMLLGLAPLPASRPGT